MRSNTTILAHDSYWEIMAKRRMRLVAAAAIAAFIAGMGFMAIITSEPAWIEQVTACA